MKDCLCCNKRLDLSLFSVDKSRKDGLCAYCQKCRKEKAQAQYAKHSSAIKKKRMEYYEKNKDKCRVSCAARYRDNPEKTKSKVREYRVKNKEKVAAGRKRWAQENPERMRELRKKSESKNPAEYKIRRRMKDMLRRTLLGSGKVKTSSTSKALGYAPSELQAHLESLFVGGMSWDNYGDWHIDHKKPIIAFVREGCHDPSIINAIDNLQPLWAQDNLSKGAKWT